MDISGEMTRALASNTENRACLTPNRATLVQIRSGGERAAQCVRVISHSPIKNSKKKTRFLAQIVETVMERRAKKGTRRIRTAPAQLSLTSRGFFNLNIHSREKKVGTQSEL